MTKFDGYQHITDSLIEAMESGVLPWRKGWTGGKAMELPRRHTGETYRGINVLLLWIAAQSRAYGSPFWMTFKQAKEYGGCVRKGEKGTQITFFNMLRKEDKETGEERKIPLLKVFTVFNADQIDGLPEKFHAVAPEPVAENDTQAIAEIEAFFAATGATIRNRDTFNPCYVPALDEIRMPEIRQFNSASNYYGTLAHELIHWTGHKSRLDRTQTQERADYAYEELIAELGNCFLASELGLEIDVTNSAAYLDSWLRALRSDKKFIFQAASAAQKATDFALELGQGRAAPEMRTNVIEDKRAA